MGIVLYGTKVTPIPLTKDNQKHRDGARTVSIWLVNIFNGRDY